LVHTTFSWNNHPQIGKPNNLKVHWSKQTEGPFGRSKPKGLIYTFITFMVLYSIIKPTFITFMVLYSIIKPTFITFMVLYSIIKPYNSFFVINRHIAWQDFILNGLFCGGRNPGKILKFTSQTFSTSVAMTSHKHKQRVVHRSFTSASRMHTLYINLDTLN
jgi:hypothetical protein